MTISVEDELFVSEYYRGSPDNITINIFDNDKSDNLITCYSLESLYVNIDINRFDQVIDNFIENACQKKREKGKIKLEFLFREKDKNDKDSIMGYFRVAVTDNGVGIDKRLHKKIRTYYNNDDWQTKGL